MIDANDAEKILRSPWQFACEWYTPISPKEFNESVKSGEIPSPETPDFGAWLTDQYRLAMNRGIQLGIEAVQIKEQLYGPKTRRDSETQTHQPGTTRCSSEK